MAEKRGAAVPLSRTAGTTWPVTRSTSTPSGVFIHPAVWPQDMGQKFGGSACALFMGVARSLSNTTLPGPTRGLFPYQLPCGILVHPAVWPQPTMGEN